MYTTNCTGFLNVYGSLAAITQLIDLMFLFVVFFLLTDDFMILTTYAINNIFL